MVKRKKDSIVYIQGKYKGRVEEDQGSSIAVEPLEGYRRKGEVLHYARFLIKGERNKP